MTDIPFHPLANIFPLIEGQHFRALVEDIREHGLREPIILFEGQILDGRNRYRACHAAQAECRFETFAGADPVAFVCSKNIHRRHLDASQLAMAGARLATLKPGRPASAEETPPIGGVSTAKAAELMNVGARSIERAREVLERGASELVAAVDKGLVAVSAAADALSMPVEEQRRVVEQVEAGKRNAVQTALKQIRRAQRERALADKQLALPDRKFGVVLEDFEWDDEVYSRETGMDRHASNHYPTAKTAHTPEEIVEATKDRWETAAADCVCGMWTTNQHLDIALRVLALRGFTYRSNFVWGKPKISTGRWNRSKHEIMLIGARGNIPAPAPGTQFESLLPGDVHEHSVKPDWQYEIFERHYPNLPKIELNARRARPGWYAWGLDAPKDPQANGSIASRGTETAVEQSAEASAGMKPLPSRLADGRTSDSSSSETDGQAEAASAVSATEFDPVTGEIIEDDGSIPAFLRREPIQQAAE